MTDELPMKMRVMMFIGSMVWKAKAAVVPKWKEAMAEADRQVKEAKKAVSEQMKDAKKAVSENLTGPSGPRSERERQGFFFATRRVRKKKLD